MVQSGLLCCHPAASPGSWVRVMIQMGCGASSGFLSVVPEGIITVPPFCMWLLCYIWCSFSPPCRKTFKQGGNVGLPYPSLGLHATLGVPSPLPCTLPEL